MTDTPLTDVQYRMLQYIRVYRAREGWAPSNREIQEYMGWSSGRSVTYQLQKLEEMGKLVNGGGPRMLKEVVNG